MLRSCKVLIAGAAFALFGLTAAANAGPSLDFPRAGTDYSSATNGSGTIPSGGQSAFMWTAGDYVDDVYNGVPLGSATSLDYSFDIHNVLGANETVNILINGIVVDSFTALDCDYCDSTDTFSNSVIFSPIVGNGTFQLTMILQNTLGPGEGSIAFLDGGSFRLDGTGGGRVPEPATLALFGMGLAGLGALRRRRKA